MWVAERAVSPTSGATTYLLVDDELRVHPEVKLFAIYLRGSGRSPETARAYVPRVGKFLNWCEGRGVDFRKVTVVDLSAYKHHLEARSAPKGAPLRGKTVNAHLTAVLEFLRFGASYDLIDAAVVERLSHRRYIYSGASGFDPGEGGQFRCVTTPYVKAKEITLPPSTLSTAEVEVVLGECLTARDRFLVIALLATGARIGEALGWRREDLHLLPDSTALGCRTPGAHVHVIPRQDNANGARAKSGRPRIVPVDGAVVRAYRDYRVERDEALGGDLSDFVFVNLAGAQRGQPLSYSNAFQVLRRTGHRAGLSHLHPHQFRHTAATSWIRAGVATDIVQSLLGHASPTSTAIYVHANDDDKRAAVEHVRSVSREPLS